MLRYYAIATLIVLSIAVIVTARSYGDFMRFRMAASRHSAPPQHLHVSGGGGGSSTQDVNGDAPWALSALPDCFVQSSETTGSVAYVRAAIPAGAQPVPDGSRLSYGPCTILVRKSELLVDRGSDHLRVPPRAELYTSGHSLVLVRTSGNSAVLRAYDITTDHQ
ncbi:MAG: hypothetical protein WB491_15400 [Candidatus Aquilonibacter sp.]